MAENLMCAICAEDARVTVVGTSLCLDCADDADRIITEDSTASALDVYRRLCVAYEAEANAEYKKFLERVAK